MANPIIVPKKSVISKIPQSSDLASGEICINHADKKLYAKHPSTGAIQEIGGMSVHSHDEIYSPDSSQVLELQNNSNLTITAGGATKTFVLPSASGTIATLDDIGTATPVPVEIGLACSDETTSITTGVAKVTFRMPCGITLTSVRANVNTAPVGSTIIVDINAGGTSILSTKLSIDASEKTSTTAATPAVISNSALSDDAEITIDVDQIGSTTAGKGLKVWLIGTR